MTLWELFALAENENLLEDGRMMILLLNRTPNNINLARDQLDELQRLTTTVSGQCLIVSASIQVKIDEFMILMTGWSVQLGLSETEVDAIEKVVNDQVERWLGLII